ncbi:MAG: hypothetical protein CVU10_00755 [Bacteroidetes bacterium HGW-Bacteroidetes-5]|jgi:hypothetical protein|nr:MAG: hypothetical protein CVU10_00755 [Bacteroidetes bacterium HGW-Bacteroidetes-5]
MIRDIFGTTFKTAALLFLLLFINGGISGQSYNQKLTGVILDKESRLPISHATITNKTGVGIKTVVTDSTGSFSITLPVGRHSLNIYAIGYSSASVNDILIGSGKEIIISVELTELRGEIQQAVVSSDQKKSNNSMATVSARRVRSQDAARYAGGYYDPLRMVTNLPGVAATNSDEDNSIVVRGNSPRSLLWRLEGIEIPNPNHLADGQGTTGGAYSLITTNSISGFDFYTAAFPAEYSNAISGVLDLTLRSGNNSKKEFSFGVGVIGAEISAEGPTGFRNGGSWFGNIRYSNFSFLQKLKIIDFKYAAITPRAFDWAFKTSVPTKGFGTFELFSIGGSSLVGDEVNINEQTSAIEDKSEFIYNYMVAVAGIKHFMIFPEIGTYIRTTVGFTYQKESMEENVIDASFNKSLNYLERYEYPSLRVSMLLNSKFNSRNTLRATYNQNYISGEMFAKRVLTQQKQDTLIDKRANGIYTNASLQWKYNPFKSIEINAGVNLFFSGVTDEVLIEPRAGIKLQLKNNQEILAGVGFHSKIEPLSVYNYKVKTTGNLRDEQNLNLKAMRSLHFTVGYNVMPAEDATFSIEAYYQSLSKIPSSVNPLSQFSIINSTHGIPDQILNNDGVGYNTGLEITIEKDFSRSFYFLLSSSLFDSKYKAPNKRWYNTYFNNGFIFNFVSGKEFVVGRSRQNILGINLRSFLRGGYRYTPVDMDLSLSRKRVVYDIFRTYGKQLPPYMRADIGISYKVNRLKSSWTFLAEIQNFTNRKNITRNRFSYLSGKIVESYSTSVGMVPVLSVRYEF